MKRFLHLIVLLFICLSLAGCVVVLEQFAGGLAGAYVGTKIGKGDSSILNGLGGAIVGAFSSETMKKALGDTEDKIRAAKAYDTAFEYSPGTVYRTDWKTHSGDHIDMEIVQRGTYQNGNDFCREFTQRIWINEKLEGGKGFGKACRDTRDPKNVWRIM